MVDWVLQFIRQMRPHWKRILLYGTAIVAVLVVIVQLFYPSNMMVPNASVDGVSVGGWRKADVAWELDRRYRTKAVQIYFGNNASVYRTPATADAGIIVKNQDRVEQITYPWWLRMIPTSLFWAHTQTKIPAPGYETDQTILSAYIHKELGQSCSVSQKDASLKYENHKLQVVRSEPGGRCDPTTINIALEKARPILTKDAVVRIPIQEIAPAVTTQTAKAFAVTITDKIKHGVPVKAGGETVVIPADIAMSWMDFSVIDGVLTFTFNNERAMDFLSKNIASKVLVPSGVSKVTTVDFIETARQEGSSGQSLHVENTLTNIQAYILAESASATAVTTPTLPRIEYIRNYTPTDEGLSALLENFAKDHPGTFGVSYIELSGKNRRATYNENKTFDTASTYKLFVAFSTLKRIDNGTWSLSDANISSGRNLEQCLDDMIVRSDNACAEVLLKKVGYRAITDEMKMLGLKNTSFLSGNSPISSAGDEALFMAQLESNQLPLKPESRSRFLDMLKRNIFRKGIPAGTSGAVANKVGFISALLHDAAIVYSPSGTYILVVMSDGSSWAGLADLTRQLESLRSS